MPGAAAEQVLAVICDDEKEGNFPGAANLAAECLQLPGTISEGVKRRDGAFHDLGWASNLIQALEVIDGGEERLFTVATVVQGPSKGLVAIGLATNQKRLQRSSNLALVLAVLHARVDAQQGFLNPSWHDLWRSAKIQPVPRTAHASTCLPPSSSSDGMEPFVFSPPLAPEQRTPPSDPTPQPDDRQIPIPGFASPVPPEASAKTSIDWGNIWEYCVNKTRWERFKPETASQLEAALFHSNKTVMINVGFSEIKVDLKAMEMSMLSAGIRCAIRRVPGHTVQAQALLPPQARIGSMPYAGVTPAVPEALLRACRPEQPEPMREAVVAALRHNDNATNFLTINTLGSADSIPLGTDCDPFCYNNAWVAARLQDDIPSLLSQCNKALRVVDAENIGRSYSNDVKREPGLFDMQGVWLALEYFKRQGVSVIVVTPRVHLKHMEGKGNVEEVVVATCAHDAEVLERACKHNCPWVSRAACKDWTTDERLPPLTQDWANKFSPVQVRWSWGPQGDFVPDFDHPSLAVRPSGSRGAGGDCDRGKWDSWPCNWCGKAAGSDGSWWGRSWCCRMCWSEWCCDRPR